MRPHERPSQTPSVLRLDVARRKDLSLHDVGLRPRIALVTRRAELKPRPALDRRVGVGALPGKRREAQERATGPVLRDDARSLDGKLVCRDRLGEGRTAVAGYVGALVLERLLGLTGQLRFCGELGGFAALGGQLCSVGGYVIALWPQLFGAAVAIALVRWLRTGPGDRNPTLEAAGIFTLIQTLGGGVLNLILG